MMKHTRKMILVPDELTEQHRPIDKILDSLDSEMQRIMNMKNIPMDIKRIKYNDVLQRHAKLQQQRNMPHEIKITDNKMSNDAAKDEQVLLGMPQTRVSIAKNLLNHIRSNPNIEIEDNGEIIVDGHKIFGSNIVDLVHDFSRDWKTHPPAIGAPEMAKALKRSNVPLEIIGNKSRLTYFLQQGNGYFGWKE